MFIDTVFVHAYTYMYVCVSVCVVGLVYWCRCGWMGGSVDKSSTLNHELD